MNHHFNVEIACEYGICESILLENIYFWIKKNKANNKHFHDGFYWTYNSIKALEALFPYMSNRKIRNALEKLENNGLLKTGNYNKLSFDRSKWYSITEKGESIYQNNIIHLAKTENGLCENVKTIPYNKPYTNTDYETYIKCFEKLWYLYPNKKGKGQVSDSKKKKIYAIGEEKFTRAIERYIKDYEKDKSWKQLQNGSTFFNSGYVDYLDGNYNNDDKGKSNAKTITISGQECKLDENGKIIIDGLAHTKEEAEYLIELNKRNEEEEWEGFE